MPHSLQRQLKVIREEIDRDFTMRNATRRRHCDHCSRTWPLALSGMAPACSPPEQEKTESAAQQCKTGGFGYCRGCGDGGALLGRNIYNVWGEEANSDYVIGCVA